MSIFTRIRDFLFGTPEERKEDKYDGDFFRVDGNQPTGKYNWDKYNWDVGNNDLPLSRSYIDPEAEKAYWSKMDSLRESEKKIDSNSITPDNLTVSSSTNEKPVKKPSGRAKAETAEAKTKATKRRKAVGSKEAVKNRQPASKDKAGNNVANAPKERKPRAKKGTATEA